MELSEKDKKAAVLILHEFLNVLDECFGRGENPLSGNTAFTIAERVKEMAAGSEGAIENSLDCYRFLSHVFVTMADREGRREGTASVTVQ